MSVSPFTRRSRSVRILAMTAVAAAGFAALGPSSAGAATSSLMTITKISVHRLPAETVNQVITITGTGFDEDLIKSVAINGCETDPTYVVGSPTMLLVKTANDCDAASTGVIKITDTADKDAVSNPAATGGAMALAFIAAPTIATASDSVKPVVTENTVGVGFAKQVTKVATKGGSVIRVVAGDVPFVNTKDYKLAASLGGVALSAITMHAGGDYFTGVVGAHPADAAPVLRITSNGVSKSFQYGEGGSGAVAGTHDFQYAGTSISVSPASGALAGGTTLSVTGAGFTSDTEVTVGGEECAVTGAVTGTLVKCTLPEADAAGPQTVATDTNGVASVVGVGSTYTFLDQ